MQDRVVVITGATGGLGRVAARAFAGKGASLVLLSSNRAKLETLAAELALPAERVYLHDADLRDPAAVREAAQAVRRRSGAAHVLLHLVGGWTGGKTLADTDPDDARAMVEQHLWTTFHLMQQFGPLLAESGWGRVLVVSSPVASRPPAKMGAYAAAKAAQEALILTLAEELKGRGVTANVLHVRTIDVEHERESEPAPSNATWTTPEEIVAAMLYLCSDEAGMVNGVRLPLTGKGL